MKLGQSPKPVWRSSQELTSRFNLLANTLNRLTMLEYVWDQLTGVKGRFWILKAVKGNTLYVQVKVSVAKNELIARRRQLITELNKHFQTPWIKKIELI